MSKPDPSSPYQMIVEGPDDKHTIIHLLKRHGYNWEDSTTTRPYIHEAKGVARLLHKPSITSALKSYRRLALVFDADGVLANRWHQLKDILEGEGLSLPATPEPDGTILPGLLPESRLGVWVMPDNAQPGRIEEFVEKLVPPNDGIWAHARKTTAEALSQGARLRQQDHVKGALYAWLAWQEDPGVRLGIALTNQVLRHDSPEAQRFVAWFHRCFS
ncbi:DUF3226 domain-containing protein [Corallococcus exercitus]|uniref:DUF4276 family protein n=1 Tax=Corallococcus exercitus TaxID=2316736 RepID=A0A7Y4NGK6_9BACT|nr:DUF3226 domain-containing protein [Corallococcus exercitus]NOK12100.1 hypothetical protein [Corallococcus exercitus]